MIRELYNRNLIEKFGEKRITAANRSTQEDPFEQGIRAHTDGYIDGNYIIYLRNTLVHGNKTKFENFEKQFAWQ